MDGRRQRQRAAALEFFQVNFLAHEFADNDLLFFDIFVGVHHDEIEFVAHRDVLLQNASLKNAETFIRIGRKPQIHARLEKFQFRTAFENPVQRNFQVRFEKQREVGLRGETVNAANPFRRAAARHVARERRESIAVAQHDVTGAQQRQQMAFVAVGKIRRVDQAERRRREQFAFFAFARGGFDQLGRIPFAEIDFDALGFEPAFEQINLRGLARTVESFDGDEPSRENSVPQKFS